MTSQFQVRLVDYKDTVGQKLLAELREELRPHHEGDPNPVPSAKNISVFLLIELDGVAVACGGLRELITQPEEHLSAEIKRMYVVPSFRGAVGVSALLMRELEKQALDHGWSTLYLETGVYMDKSRAFYERQGYELCEPFAKHVLLDKSVSYKKDLVECQGIGQADANQAQM